MKNNQLRLFLFFKENKNNPDSKKEIEPKKSSKSNKFDIPIYIPLREEKPRTLSWQLVWN